MVSRKLMMATMTWGRAGMEPLSRAGAAGPTRSRAPPPRPTHLNGPQSHLPLHPQDGGPGEREVSPRLGVPAVQASADPRLLLELDSGRQPCPQGAESRRGGAVPPERRPRGAACETRARARCSGDRPGGPRWPCFSSRFLCPARAPCWSSMLSGFLTSGPSSTITHVAPLRGLTWGRGRPCPDAASGQWLGREQQEGPDGRAAR